MEANEALRSLRSIRRYERRSVPDELVSSWLESARWCGSSRNSQPWRFVVVRAPRTRRKLATLGDDAGHLAAADVVVALAAVPGPYPFSTVFDLGRVAQVLQLAAFADGIGSCVAVFEPATNMDKARQLLDVPDQMRLDLAIGFGWPAPPCAGDPEAIGRPKGRLPFSDVVFHERFG